MAPPHTQSAWEYRGERFRATGLAAYCNYFLKEKNYTKFYLFDNLIVTIIKERDLNLSSPHKDVEAMPLQTLLAIKS